MSTFEPMTAIIPPGAHGVAKVEHFDVGADASRYSALRAGGYVGQGRYARLLVRNQLLMSDTGMEHRTNVWVVYTATGSTLITGLGLGMVLVPILRKPDVQRVVVIEKHADVVALIEQPLRKYLGKDADKLTVLVADAYEFDGLKGEKFDVIYHDIWGDQSTDCLEEMTLLKRRYRRLMAKGCQQRCWREDELRARKRREQKDRWGFR